MSARWGDARPIVCVLAAAVLSMTFSTATGASPRGQEIPAAEVDSNQQLADGMLLIDAFTDNEYTTTPPWTVPRATWGATLGYLESTDVGSQIIHTPRTEGNGIWEFRWKIETADNTLDEIRFYFVTGATIDATNGPTTGYYIDINGQGGVYNLVRRNSVSSATVLIASSWTADANWHTAKLSRLANGFSQLYFDGVSKGTVTDNTYTTSSFIAVHNLGSSGDSLHNGWIDDITWLPPAVPPTATVTAPNGAEAWVGGSQHTISWTSAQGDFPLKADSATLYYSTNGCSGTWTQIVAGQPVSGSYSWTVVNTPTAQACVRVTVEDDQTPANLGSDVSNAVFSIIAGNSPPVIAIVAPAAGGGLSGRTSLQWDASDANSNTVSYRLQLSQDSGGTWSPLTNVSYPETPISSRRSVPFDSTTFGDRTTYRLSIEANDGNGSRVWSNSTADWSIDNTEPACTMTALPAFVTNPQIPLTWNGTDAISGIAGYDIMVSEDGAPKWGFLWNATNTSATFPGQGGITYGFYCEPWDKAGNHQTKPAPDTTTVVDNGPPSSRVVNMPPYVGSLTFDVPFTVVDSTATSTVIHWRLAPTGAWTQAGPFPLPKGQTQGNGQVTVSGSGTYEFYSVATDTSGQAESKSQVKEDETIVDLLPPTITASVHETLVAGNKVTITIDAFDDPLLKEVRVEFMPSDGSAQWVTILAFNAINKANFQTIATPVTLTTAADGKQKVRAVAVDVADQATLSAESEVTLDLTKPTVISITPANGTTNVPVAGPFVVAFSEEMNATSVLAAMEVSGNAKVTNIDWSGNDAKLTIAGLSGNMAYTIKVSTAARDVLGNRLAKATETKFTIVPTHGSLVGSLKEPGGAVVKGAVLQLTLDTETITVDLSKDGLFTLDPLRAGKWTVHAEARGYVPLDTTVDVVVGEQGRADFTMQKDIIPTIIGVTVGLAALGIAGFIVMRLLRKKCPKCATVLARSATACANCGHVLKKASRLDVQRDARLAREAESKDHRKALAAQYKLKKAESARIVGPAAGMQAQVAPRKGPRPTECLACRTSLKPEEEWCSKCGQAVGGGGECIECGGTIMDGTCVSCGTPAGGAGAPTEKRVPCPRCMARVTAGAELCDECGFDLTRNKENERSTPPTREADVSAPPALTPTLPPTTTLAVLPAGPAATSPAASTTPDAAPLPATGAPVPTGGCPTCGTVNPGSTQWCDVCGEKVR